MVNGDTEMLNVNISDKCHIYVKLWVGGQLVIR